MKALSSKVLDNDAPEDKEAMIVLAALIDVDFGYLSRLGADTHGGL